MGIDTWYDAWGILEEDDETLRDVKKDTTDSVVPLVVPVAFIRLGLVVGHKKSPQHKPGAVV